MAIDPKYRDNVVLKQEAFQNLLTNIKNYPIVDIDYVGEMDADELHGDTIWEHYTDGIPCIKITYGDDRTTKGNVIFADEYRTLISSCKKQISQFQAIINELIKRKSRWEAVYEQNYAVYKDKDKQVQRFRDNFSQINNNKLAFLKAGWNLLYIANDLQVDDPYERVIEGVTFNIDTIYYTHTDDYLFHRYEYNNNGTLIDVADSIDGTTSPALLQAVRDDWEEKRDAGQMYTRKENYEDLGPVIFDTLGPDWFSYQNILLTKNPYELVSTTSSYDSSVIYYLRRSSISAEFDTYDGNGTAPGSEFYNTVVADWNDKVQNRLIYIKNAETDTAQTFNLTYTSLDHRRVDLISTLLAYKNQIDPNTGASAWTSQQADVFQAFINFILSYNKLVFLDTIGIAGYTEEDIARLKAEAEDRPNAANRIIINIIDELTEERRLGDFSWENSPSWSVDLDGYYTTFNLEIGNIVTIINNIINNNLIYIRDQIRTISYNIIKYNEEIQRLEDDIAGYQENIAQAATERYDLIEPNSIFNAEREYYTKTINNEYERYTPEDYQTNPGVWASGNVYVKNDRTIYGYKYVKVGSNILFDSTYTKLELPCCSPMEDLEKQQPTAPSSQASGTFRITINQHIYEIPIKGFTNEFSDQPVYISTNHSSGMTLNVGSLERNINFYGNLTGAGNIITNNGHIFASGGAVGAGTYQALRGYYEGTGDNPFNASSENGASAGFWYDGSANKLIRTWNISEDADNVGLGAYQYTFTRNANGTKTTSILGGFSYDSTNNIIECHTGLPSTSSSYAGIKVSSLIVNGNTIDASALNNAANGGNTGQFWRGRDTNTTGSKPGWSNALIGQFRVEWCHSALNGNNTTTPTSSTASIYTTGGILADRNVKGQRVFGAVFNDYAEYRSTINLDAGRVVVDNDNGTLRCADQRLMPGAQVISDTFGFSIGETDKAKTPLAIAGRVLVYTYQDRNKYHAGMAVCSAPNGTIDIMTRDEIREYPDCIIGIVSEIPDYDEWGTDKVKVNGRIWIKIK